MIVWNEKVKKSEDVIRAVINELYKENINTDGVVEIFNNGKEQGCLLKIFDKYNPNLDLCFWVYLPENRSVNNEISIIIGKHIDCDKLNMWSSDNLNIQNFSDAKAREMHNLARDYIIDSIKDNLNKTHDIPSI